MHFFVHLSDMLCISCKNQHFQGFQALILLDASWVPLGASGRLWVPLGASGCLWVPPGCILGVSWVSPGSLLGVSWESPGSLLGAPGSLLMLLGVSWVFPGSLLDVSWESPGVSWCLLSVSGCLLVILHPDASQMPLRCFPLSDGFQQMPLRCFSDASQLLRCLPHTFSSIRYFIG